MNKTPAILAALLLSACEINLPPAAVSQSGGAPVVVLHDTSPMRAVLIRTADGQCLDISGGDGKSLIRYPCHGRANQQFRFDAKSGAITQNGGCLDVAGAEKRDGTPVIRYRCTGAANQQWYADGGRIRSADSGKCLDASEHRLAVRRCNGSRAQQFAW